jgi:hypothetical protein
MTQPKIAFDTIHDFLGKPLRVGEPDVAGRLAVFPVFGPKPRLEYIAFAEGHKRGVRVLEREGGASVNELVIENPTDFPVLLYEGEEVLGAQQNRIFDVSVLVAAGSKLEVPVTCVEAGRWDSSRHRDELSPSRHAAYLKLRHSKAKSKSRRVHEHLNAVAEARADQSTVWSGIALVDTSHGTHSPTGAMHDIYESERARLEEMRRAIRLHDGQAGAIVAIGGELLVLDYVSRPDVFAVLHGPLVEGYALDALEAEESETPRIDAARGFALLVADCGVARRAPSLGLGEEIRIASNGVAGSALAVDRELVQLTAFPGDHETDESPAPRRARVARPTRRRR